MPFLRGSCWSCFLFVFLPDLKLISFAIQRRRRIDELNVERFSTTQSGMTVHVGDRRKVDVGRLRWRLSPHSAVIRLARPHRFTSTTFAPLNISEILDLKMTRLFLKNHDLNSELKCQNCSLRWWTLTTELQEANRFYFTFRIIKN